MPRRNDPESLEGATPEQTLVRKIVMQGYRPKSAETSAAELRLLAWAARFAAAPLRRS